MYRVLCASVVPVSPLKQKTRYLGVLWVAVAYGRHLMPNMLLSPLRISAFILRAQCQQHCVPSPWHRACFVQRTRLPICCAADEVDGPSGVPEKVVNLRELLDEVCTKHSC